MEGVPVEKGTLFGTDGVRGRANEPPMTAEMALALGRAVGALVQCSRQHTPLLQQQPYFEHYHRPRIVVGKDTRLSGDLFQQAIGAGLASMGCDIIFVGELPTPGIAFITRSMRADAGIVISASHNLFQDNGIKVFDRDGFKLPEEDEVLVDRWTTGAEPLPMAPAVGEAIGRAMSLEDATGRYVVYLKSTFPPDLDLEGLRIVVDCAHGAAHRVAPSVLEELGAQVISIGVDPDGMNINQDCGSMHPQEMQAVVRQQGAQIGIALDGDADRVVLADEKGELLDGDHLMAICARRMKERGGLARDTVVATAMSNLGMELALRSMGVRLLRTPVGDRYVVLAMRAGGYNLGGEQAGHVVFLDHGTTGDGVLAAMQILAVMLRKARPLSELSAGMHRVPQVLINVEVGSRPRLEELPRVTAAVRQAEAELGGEGRVLLRYSGTEMLARVMVEGVEEDLVKAWAEGIAQEVRAAIGRP